MTKKSLNGKKRYIVTGISGLIGTGYFIKLLFQLNGDVSAHNVKIEVHDKKITKIEEVSSEIPVIKKDISYLTKGFDEFKAEQKTLSSQLSQIIDLLKE